MEKKGRAVKDKRYEDKHKAERKAKCMVFLYLSNVRFHWLYISFYLNN